MGSKPTNKREFTIRMDASFPLEPRYFFDDSLTNEHEDATELECAREVSRYIEKHGLSRFLLDWNLDDVDVYVGNFPALLKGIPITETAQT